MMSEFYLKYGSGYATWTIAMKDGYQRIEITHVPKFD